MKKHQYLGLKVWKWLRLHPGSKSGDVAEAMGWSPRRASWALYTLQRGHNAIYEGNCARGVWRATDVKPRDGRGLAPGSAIGRFKGPLNLPKANAKLAELSAAGKLRRTRKCFKQPSVFDGKIALEQCWPVFRGSLAAPGSVVKNTPREDAPSENEEAA